MRPLALTIFAMLFATMTGCSGLREWKNNGGKVGPEYSRPVVPLASEWLNGTDAHVAVDASIPDDWWRVFHDPILENLICVAYQNNKTLQCASARVLQTRAQRGIAAGNLFPQTQQRSGAFSAQRNSVNATPPGLSRTVTSWSTGFSLAWELDVWGRLRRSIEAADAEMNASIEDYDGALVTLVSDVATIYMQIRSLETRIQFARDNARIQERTLEITETKNELGAVSNLDVQQAVTNLRQTEALIPSLELSRRQLQNLLAVLLGMAPRDLTDALGGERHLPMLPEEVVVGIPADLIRSRPDVRSAERSVAAQSARIGIAEADLYPQFTLSGNFQVNATDFVGLFDSDNRSAFFSPSFRWNILNYGRIKNNVLVQEAAYLQLVAKYENAVLIAQKEVEDAMSLFLYSRRRVETLRLAAEAAQEAVKLGEIQWREGKIQFSQVFMLESTLTSVQDALAAAELDAALGVVDVYRALGGGWQVRCENYFPNHCQLIEDWPVDSAAHSNKPTNQSESYDPFVDAEATRTDVKPKELADQPTVSEYDPSYEGVKPPVTPAGDWRKSFRDSLKDCLESMEESDLAEPTVLQESPLGTMNEGP